MVRPKKNNDKPDKLPVEPGAAPAARMKATRIEDEVDDILRDGYLIDYISGKQVKDGPEERDAVQVFAKMLVEDYGYPKVHIQTRPQYRVKVRPSGGRRFRSSHSGFR